MYEKGKFYTVSCFGICEFIEYSENNMVTWWKFLNVKAVSKPSMKSGKLHTFGMSKNVRRRTFQLCDTSKAFEILYGSADEN